MERTVSQRKKNTEGVEKGKVENKAILRSSTRGVGQLEQ